MNFPPIRSFQAPRHTPVISRPKQERPPRLCSANANDFPNCRSRGVCKTTPFVSCRYKGPLVCLLETVLMVFNNQGKVGGSPTKALGSCCWVLFCFVCFQIRFLSRVISVKAWAPAFLTGHVSSISQLKKERTNSEK